MTKYSPEKKVSLTRGQPGESFKPMTMTTTNTMVLIRLVIVDCNLLMNTILASFELDLTYLVSVRGIVLPGFGWCCGHVMNVARFLNAGMAGCHRKIPAAPGQGVVTL